MGIRGAFAADCQRLKLGHAADFAAMDRERDAAWGLGEGRGGGWGEGRGREEGGCFWFGVKQVTRNHHVGLVWV